MSAKSVATVVLLGLFGCATQPALPGTGEDGGAAGLCIPCVIDTDCASSGGVCAQFGGDMFCARSCPLGQSDCTNGTTCKNDTSAAGDPLSVCEPNNNACGTPVGQDAGRSNDGGVFDSGPITATIGPNGGTETKLYFAVVGDTRPPVEDDTAGYPSAVIGKIYADVTALNPMPPFVIGTGDYQFSNPWGSEAPKQFALYNAAKSKYSGIEFPAMGNHECTGGTATNCGPGSSYPTTNNYSAFVSALLAPIGKTQPYYSLTVNAANSAWTAKFVVIAANYWNSAQAAWLDSTLAQPTTYTFVVRHESAKVTSAPGVSPSEAIMAKYPYTLAIVGHTHTYYHSATREVVFGNGGAPLSSSGSYGFGLVIQRDNGNIEVDEIDMNTGLADSNFRFALHPNGTPAP